MVRGLGLIVTRLLVVEIYTHNIDVHPTQPAGSLELHGATLQLLTRIHNFGLKLITRRDRPVSRSMVSRSTVVLLK